MDRPRRTVKPASRGPVQVTVSSCSLRTSTKRNAPAPVDPEKQLKTLLQSSKSDLVSVDMSDIINAHTWAMLSDESKDCLKTMLPPSAFLHFKESIPDNHPSIDALRAEKSRLQHSSAQPMDVENTNLDSMDGVLSTGQELNNGFFNDPHFLAAMRTFQDHLYLNWFASAHEEKVKQFRDGVANGTISAPWKDEVWDRNMISNLESSTSMNGWTSHTQGSLSSTKAGGAAEIKLSTLVKNQIVRVGDVLSYRRTFASPLTPVIEKDCIIESVAAGGIAVLLAPGEAKFLQPYLLSNPPSSQPSDLSQDLSPQSATITSPTMLENLVLDMDGRLEKSNRPNANAWKSFSVWRWRKAGLAESSSTDAAKRGGRENHGTLFYLRGSFYNER